MEREGENKVFAEHFTLQKSHIFKALIIRTATKKIMLTAACIHRWIQVGWKPVFLTKAAILKMLICPITKSALIWCDFLVSKNT